MTSVDVPRHGKLHSIAIDIPESGAMFIKLTKEFEDDEQVIVDTSDDKKPTKGTKKTKTKK